MLTAVAKVPFIISSRLVKLCNWQTFSSWSPRNPLWWLFFFCFSTTRPERGKISLTDIYKIQLANFLFWSSRNPLWWLSDQRTTLKPVLKECNIICSQTIIESYYNRLPNIAPWIKKRSLIHPIEFYNSIIQVQINPSWTEATFKVSTMETLAFSAHGVGLR